MYKHDPHKKEEEISTVNATMRSLAGIGVGYTAIQAYRRRYYGASRGHFGVSLKDDVKRAYTKILQFSGAFFQKHDQDVKTGMNDYLANIGDHLMIEGRIDELLNKKNQINRILAQTQRIIKDIENVALKNGANPSAIEAIKNPFMDFADNYSKRALNTLQILSNENLSGLSHELDRTNLMNYRFDQITALNDQLRIVKDRARIIENQIRTVRQNVNRMIKTSEYQVLRAAPEAIESINLLKNNGIERIIKEAGSSVSGVSSFKPVQPDDLINKSFIPQVWEVKTNLASAQHTPSLRSAIGKEGVLQIGNLIRENYNDPLLKETKAWGKIAQERKIVRNEFFSGLKDTIRELQRSNQFSKVEVGLVKHDNSAVVIKATPIDKAKFAGQDVSFKLEIPKSEGGILKARKGGKEFFTPFTKQKDLLLEQTNAILARVNKLATWDPATINEKIERIRINAFNHTMQPSVGGLVDLMRSQQIDAKLTHRESKLYQQGWDAFNKIHSVRKGGGGILHIDTEFGKSGIPTEIGWTLFDERGNPVDGYHFVIGDKAKASVPAHTRGTFLNNHNVIQEINEGELNKVLDALHSTMNSPTVGGPIKIAGKSWGLAEGRTLEMLIKEVEAKKLGASPKIAALRASLFENTVIDTNALPTISGETKFIQGDHLFRLIRKHASKMDDTGKEAILSKLRMIGINSLDEIGQETFEKGLHTAFQDSFMQGLYTEVMYMVGQKTYGNNPARYKEVGRLLKKGIKPRELIPGHPGEVEMASYINLSANSFLGGGASQYGTKLDLSESYLSFPFADLRPGLEYRGVAGQQVRHLGKHSIDRRIIRKAQQMAAKGYRVDLGQLYKRTLNEIRTKALVYLDPGDSQYLPKEEFVLSQKFMKGLNVSDPYVVSVSHLAEGVKVGTELGFGTAGGGKGGPTLIGWENTKPIHFNGRDNAQRGVITAIDRAGDGSYRIVVNRQLRVGHMTPVIGGSAAAQISNRSMEEIFPHLGGGFSSFRLAGYNEKTNPGAAMSDMLSLLFHHAGNDRTKKDVLKHLLKQKFGVDAFGNLNLPIRETATGFLDFDNAPREVWNKITKMMDMGKIIELSDKYNQSVTNMNDPFTATNILFSKARPKREEIEKATASAERAFTRMMFYDQAVEANVGIAMRNLRRETSTSQIGTIANEVRELLKSGRVVEAMKRMRPDMDINTSYEYFSKAAALFGFGKDYQMQWRPLGVSKDPMMLKNIDTMAGLGKISGTKGAGSVRIGLDFLEKLKILKGSEKLYKSLVEDVLKENATTVSRMFPLNFATSTTSIPGITNISRENVSAFMSKNLDKWLNLPSTVADDFMPVEHFYELNGRVMSESMATQQLGMSKLSLDEAIQQGKATKLNWRDVKKRLRAPEDVQQIFRMQPFAVNFGRDARAIQVKYTEPLAKIERMLMTSPTEQDYYPVWGNAGGKKRLYYMESPVFSKQREILRALNSGIFMEPSGKNGSSLVQEYFDLLGQHVPKHNLSVYKQTAMVPVVRLQSNLHFDFPQLQGGATTKAEALKVLSNVFHTKTATANMFLNARGLMPGEGMITGTSEKTVDKFIENWFSRLSDDEVKAMANRVVGSVQMGEKSGIAPRSYMLRALGGTLETVGGPLEASNVIRNKCSSALGVLQKIANTKQLTKGLKKGMLGLVKSGMVAMPGFGAKWPLTDQTKFVGEWFYKASVSGEEGQKLAMKLGTGTGGIGVVTSGSLFEGNIDADGDFITFLMGKGEKTLNIMKQNSFMQQLDPVAVVSDKSRGMITFFNTTTGSHWQEPFAVAQQLLGLDKSATVESEIITKQLAGKITTFSDNIRYYMNNALNKRGSKLANDLGQEGIERIWSNVNEATGALIEGILKGKSTTGGETIQQMMENFGNESTIRSFAERIEAQTRGKTDFKSRQLAKILTPIAGTEALFEGSTGVNMVDIMIQSARAGRAMGMGSMSTAEETFFGTNFRMENFYGKRGKMVQAQVQHELTKNIPTHFTPWAQEKLLTSMKRNIAMDVGERKWKLTSTGMGWAAAIGGIMVASNLFRPNDNDFLGERPGVGGEAYDYTFTRPEYKMANLLDQPYDNPWAKNPVYIEMENPRFLNKMAQLSNKEKHDIALIQRSINMDPIRQTYRSTSTQEQMDYKELLMRYGRR